MLLLMQPFSACIRTLLLPWAELVSAGSAHALLGVFMINYRENEFFSSQIADSQLPSAFIIQLLPSKDLKCFLCPVGPLEKHPRIEVLGRCCDGSSRQWSIKMRWNTPKGIQVQNLPETKIQDDYKAKNFTLLPRYGCPITLDYGKSLHDFLQEIRNELPVIVDVQTPGWFQDSQYVLPEESVGVAAETIPYLSSDGYQEMYRCRGTLEGWKKLAELACGNTRLEFALCSAFAAPLLRLLNIEGGGFHFVGKSSSGKTTALTVASTVWGHKVRSWRTTENGLEHVAKSHNDSLLLLDEIGEVNGRQLENICYMLANGEGKSRSTPSGRQQRSSSWRLLFLSTGEVGLAEKMASRQGPKTGQEVRFVPIQVCKEMLRSLHDYPDAASFIEAVKDLAMENQGFAGRAFLTWLTTDMRSKLETLQAARKEKEQLLLSSRDGNREETVQRIATRFAVVWAAGEAAQQAGILPGTMNVGAAVRSCFTSWRNLYQTPEEKLRNQFFKKLILTLDRDAAHFVPLGRGAKPVNKQYGFTRKVDDQVEYLFFPSAFRTLFSNSRDSIRWLKDKGWLHCGRERNTLEVRVGSEKKHFYVIARRPKSSNADREQNNE